MVVTPSFRVMPNPYGAFTDAREHAQDRAQQQREIQYRDTQRQGAQAYGQYLAAGDTDAAATVAGKLGDAEGAIAARTMGQEELFRTAQQFNERLVSIAQMTDPNQQRTAYMAWYNEALQTAQRGGLLNDDVRAAFDSEHPAPDAPNLHEILPQLAQSSQQRLQSMAQQGLTRSQWSADQTARAAAQYEHDQDERRFQQTERRLDQGDRRLDASIARGNGASQEFTRANAFRDEYNQQTAGYRTIADFAARSESYVQRANAGNPSGQGDVGLVYALAKIYDPTSVVREGEFAMVARQGGYGEQMRSWVNTALGHGFSPQIRNQIMAEIRSGVQSAQGQRDQTRARYESLAQRAGIDPALVIDDYGDGGGNGGADGGDPQMPANIRRDHPDYVLLRDANGNPTGWGPPR